jgi:hypothetical protein
MRRAAALSALILALYFSLSAVIIHYLNPGLWWINQPLSRYALGSWGIILGAGFICIGLTEVILALLNFLKKEKITPFNTLLFLAGCGVITVAFFPMDTGSTETIAGTIHKAGAAVQFLAFPAALFFPAAEPEESRYSFYTIMTGILVFLLSAVLGIYTGMGIRDTNAFGLVQKINTSIITAWLLTESCRRAFSSQPLSH